MAVDQDDIPHELLLMDDFNTLLRARLIPSQTADKSPDSA